LLNRRAWLQGAIASLIVGAARADADPFADAVAALATLEAKAGGRLGVCVLDPIRGRTLAYRADERFPLTSTFKALAAAAVLARVDAGVEQLDRRILYSERDLLSYAPVTKAHVAEGMTLGELCAAAIDYSDNTTGNLQLEAIGGPAGLTAYLRTLGDEVSRLDRVEPDLNEAAPGDLRDTTSPRAYAQNLRTLVMGDKLSQASRAQLEAWLIADKVGDKRLRAGLPADWRIGDKTGSGERGTANTIAILRPPGRGPLLAGVFFTDADASMDARNDVHRRVAEIIARAF